ncbi:MAG: hypothetical protein Q9222_001934 [Ikaeria aurantiellina]
MAWTLFRRRTSWQCSILQINVTAPPRAFKAEIVPDPTKPIDVDELWHLALHAMWDITSEPMVQPLFDQLWHSNIGPAVIYIEHVPFGKDPSRLYAQYLVWGLNQMFLSMQLFNRWCATTATLKWDGVTVGTIRLLAAPPPARISWNTPKNPSDIFQVFAGRENGTTESLDFDRVFVRIAYGSQKIAKNLIFLTCLKVMGEAAEKGLKTIVPFLSTQGLQQTSFKLLDKTARGTMEAGYAREAATKAVARMIHDNEFVETFVWVDVDGVEAAVGGYTQGPRPTA